MVRARTAGDQKNAGAYVQPIAHVATVTPFPAPDDNTYPSSEAPDASALAAMYPKRDCYYNVRSVLHYQIVGHMQHYLQG